MALSGKRKFSKKFTDAVTPHLHLTESEAKFLPYLIEIGQAKSHTSRLEGLRKIQQFRYYQLAHNSEIQAYKYLTKWYYVAIREMADLPDFQLNAEWIQSRLWMNVSLAEVKEAIQFLMESGFLKKASALKVAKLDKQITCFEEVHRISMAEYHREMFKIASQSIYAIERNSRLLLGHTVALNDLQYEEAKAIITEALEKIANLQTSNENAKTEVYQFELAAFPITKKAREEEK